jgi:AcrR family transcriptional regulator
MQLFAERGFAGTSMRDVADAAGVSPGLVQHHFRTKAGLREACDKRAIDVFRQTKTSAMDQSKMADPGALSAMYRMAFPVARYLARALAEGSPGAREVFDEVVDITEELLKKPPGALLSIESNDLRAVAAVLTAENLGIIVLHEHLSRVLGEDIFTRAGYPRVALAAYEIHSQPMLRPSFLEAAQRGMQGFRDGKG